MDEITDGDEVERWMRSAQRGDEEAFGRLVERFRPELVLHCYRMLGRLDDAEDATQDALLRAWRGIGGFRSDARVRTWLYRIATNTCLDRHSADQRRRRILAAGLRHDGVTIPVAATVPWLQAVPDAALDAVDAQQPDHADRLTSRETIELAYVAALQHLPARQRAVFLLRDVVGWTAAETAGELDVTVSAANAALHRARTTMRTVLGAAREEWPVTGGTGRQGDSAATGDTGTGDTEADDAHAATAGSPAVVARRFAEAVERGDGAALAAILAPDVLVSHQPHGGQPTADTAWYAGRDLVITEWEPAFPLDLRMVPVRLNRQVAFACYARLPGTDDHRPFGITVLRFDGAHVVEVVNLDPSQFDLLDLPPTP